MVSFVVTVAQRQVRMQRTDREAIRKTMHASPMNSGASKLFRNCTRIFALCAYSYGHKDFTTGAQVLQHSAHTPSQTLPAKYI